MFLKKLEIFGFKSFADKTILNFDKGITTIVGPNGCGKSNIFDSIRWVLGEQSAKELRGSSMEDVIFNGTETKPSLGFAEVSLTFSNESQLFPIEAEEVVITRRLFRSGESEYMINKNISRLKDIQEMCMGTGIGAEAYSLIQQGKVDLVVSARPEERRIIFDEASGITKYKAKKKEALNKLKHTDDNLLRINDITVEIKRQISSIERQANKARKYKAEYEKLKNMEIRIARNKMNSFVDDKEQILSRMQELKRRQDQLQEELARKQEDLSQEMNYLSELEQKMNDCHSQEIKLDGQITLHNRQIGFNQQRIEDLLSSGKKLSEQKEQLIHRCQNQQSKLEELKQEIASSQGTIEYNEKSLNEKREGFDVIEKNILEAKKKIREHEEKILVLTSSQVNVRNELTDVMKELQGGLARKRRLQMENDKVCGEKEAIDQKLQNVIFQINAFKGVIAELRLNKRDKSLTLNEMKASINSLEQNIDEQEKKRLFYKSQKEFIEKLQTQYQEIPDPIIEGRLFTETPPAEKHGGIVGKVKDVRLLSEGEFQMLKEKFSNDPQNIYEVICETKFIEIDPQQMSNRIDEITQRIEGLSDQRQMLTVQHQTQNNVILKIEEEIQDKERSVSILEAQQNDITEEMNKLVGELDLVGVELVEVKESITESNKKEEELNYELDTVSKDISWCQNDVKEKQGCIAGKMQEREAVTVSIAQLESERESEKEKMVSLKDNLTMFSENLDSWLEEIKGIDDELVSQSLKKDQCVKESEELVVKIEDIDKEKETLKEENNHSSVRKHQLLEQTETKRSSLKGMEEKIEEVHQQLHDQQMKEQELTFNQKGIKDCLLQTYKIDWDTLPEESRENIEDPSAQEENVSSISDEDLERLKKRCESYGNVNLVAIEEYEELKKRFEFLTQQQSDLLEAKSQLMNTIRKINRSTRQMFMDTFTKVGEEFRIYFRMLFGGGEAQLVLLDPENVLESGIDIIARPPGKKLQNISLLSGGEKSLAAIALIFGVFKVNPSPFCVLDEIDAALDEANVGRYSYLLKDFANIAQFIVITHNKKTISISDVMYGITMPETGISRIVSVKFSEEEKNKKSSEVPVSA